ncbi:nitrate reductase molybdenum cofactor assembly chaperone [Chitinasiproducens palmae]|uniref:Respiratory nitrate reductase chaperone NarJ n=1 Tax=Chitinasiproducens palmae TaxID=1770053 RepID=A0A1H2PUP6_9BURK|nr:nitrate reductase molybdenum cofactor assembly chaperone [Chitinasiproducens palmae]SDV50512.1 respiratory nitrate reductase chaperone NarJ [Chitinasiproducens palmae]
MRILKVASLLLDYPCSELVDGREALADAIRQAREIGPDRRRALLALLDELTMNDLLDVQERYDGLFDRGRHLSLLLFEHVHGESRDRGQAMVDLLAHYHAAGFAIGRNELPDHIPLYLEFLSTRDAAGACEGLADVAHLLALLAKRLDERQSPYATIFRALLDIAGHADGVDAIDAADASVDGPLGQGAGAHAAQDDDSLEALDRAWAEEQVSFLAAGQQGCASGCASTERAGGPPPMPAEPPEPHAAHVAHAAHAAQGLPEPIAVPMHWVDFVRTRGAEAARS